MNLNQAIKQKRQLRLLSAPLFLITIVLLAVAVLKSFYGVANDPATPSMINDVISKMVAMVYHSVWLVPELWSLVPSPSLSPLVNIDNLFFAFIVFAWMLSVFMWKKADWLSLRIHKAKLDVEDDNWRNDLR